MITNKIIYLLIFLFISCASSDKKEVSPEKKKANIYYNQGTNELIQKNYTTALRHLLEAKALDPNNPQILNNLGMAYYFKKRPELAIRTIKQAIKNDPKNMEARINLGTIYTNIGRYIEAKNQYAIVSENLTYPKQFKTYFNLGVLNLKQGRKSLALNYFQQSLNENENYCPASVQLGNMYFDSKDYKKSLEYYKKASQGVCYNNPDPIYKQAQALIKLKKYGSAKMKLEEILERFSLTEYQELASKQLKALNQKIQVDDSEEADLLKLKRKILSPNF